MSNTPSDDPGTNILIEYLLGQLPPAESEALEDAYFSDTALFERLSELELELIREYLRGGLDGVQRKAFEEVYLADPTRRGRFEAEREWFEAARLVRADGRRRWRGGLSEWWRGRNQWGVVAVAGVFVSVAVLLPAWTWQRTSRIEVTLQRLEASVAAVRAPRTPLSFLLSPELTRGSSESHRFRIPSGTDRVVFRLELQGGPSYPVYRGSLRAVGGAEAWSGKASYAENAASVEIPGDAFSTNDYILLLDGVASNGQPIRAGSYTFGVISK